MICRMVCVQNGRMCNEGGDTGCGDDNDPPKARLPSWFPLHSSVPIPSFRPITWRAATYWISSTAPASF